MISKIFNNHNTDPDLYHTVYTLLNMESVDMVPPFNQDYIKILTSQRKIDIDSIYYRIMAKQWVITQK